MPDHSLPAPGALLDAARALEPNLLRYRRALHRAPEVGALLPQSVAYVKSRLAALGLAPRDCAGGVVAEICGHSAGRCVLLRADMDALAISEQTALPFRAENGAMHACGHDLHTAMLLGAAALLQRYRAALRGTVRLVFQPDEEGFTGAKAMLASGVLDAPRPDAAIALHVHSGTPTGQVLYGVGDFMAGCTLFRVTVRGRGCHGAMPETGVDPIAAAAHIALALHALPAHETAAQTPAVISLGRFDAGRAANVIPDQAVLEGSIRTFDRALSARLFSRVEQIADAIARALGARAKTRELASAPPLYNNGPLTAFLADTARQLFGADAVTRLPGGGMGSEDFAAFTGALPCAYVLLGAGTREEDARFGAPMHASNVVFNEAVLPRGAALHAYAALRLLAGA